MLIDQIKADRLAALKSRDELKKNLLGTLVAAATKDSKAPDDAAVAKTVRSFLKSLEETIGLLAGRGLDTAQQRAETAILQGYLPQPLSEAALRASIHVNKPRTASPTTAAATPKSMARSYAFWEASSLSASFALSARSISSALSPRPWASAGALTRHMSRSARRVPAGRPGRSRWA